MKKNPWFKEFHDKSFYISFEKQKPLEIIESRYQKIEVFNNRFWGNVLAIDGLIMITEKDEFFYHESIAHPPFFLNKDIKDVIIIGGGDGGTLREILKHDVEKVSLIEIDEEVVNVSKKHFPSTATSFDDERVEILFEDGVKFIENYDGKADLIIIDSSEPIGPSQVLFEDGFYKLMSSKTKENGIIVSQIGSFLFHKKFVRDFFNKVRDNFKYSALYTGSTPTYPGGVWTYGIFSKSIDILKEKYDNSEILYKYMNEWRFRGSILR
jgi:spermidine synthase